MSWRKTNGLTSNYNTFSAMVCTGSQGDRLDMEDDRKGSARDLRSRGHFSSGLIHSSAII